MTEAHKKYFQSSSLGNEDKRRISLCSNLSTTQCPLLHTQGNRRTTTEQGHYLIPNKIRCMLDYYLFPSLLLFSKNTNKLYKHLQYWLGADVLHAPSSHPAFCVVSASKLSPFLPPPSSGKFVLRGSRGAGRPGRGSTRCCYHQI